MLASTKSRGASVTVSLTSLSVRILMVGRLLDLTTLSPLPLSLILTALPLSTSSSSSSSTSSTSLLLLSSFFNVFRGTRALLPSLTWVNCGNFKLRIEDLQTTALSLPSLISRCLCTASTRLSRTCGTIIEDDVYIVCSTYTFEMVMMVMMVMMMMMLMMTMIYIL